MVDSVRWFKSRAKALLRAFKAHDPSAADRVRAVVSFPPEGVGLQRVQHVVAVEAGFACWQALVRAPEDARLLALVMEEQRWLNYYGVGQLPKDRRKPRNERLRIVAANRAQLRESVDDVMWTAGWLRENVQKIKTINRSTGSYELKHLAERHSPTGYLSNGVFIAAALVAGYPYETTGLNARFGMSQRSIKRLWRATYGRTT